MVRTAKKGFGKSSAVNDDAGARCMGRSRGGLTTEIHALVDANGHWPSAQAHRGQAHDERSADRHARLVSAKAKSFWPTGGYDSDALRVPLSRQGRMGTIHQAHAPTGRTSPPSAPFSIASEISSNASSTNSSVSSAVATRYEKHDANYLAARQTRCHTRRCT